jgi:asparagine synthase (glutamine-hydrolysing)
MPLSVRRGASALALPALERTGANRAGLELIRRFGTGEPLFWGGAIVYDELLKPRLLSNRFQQNSNGQSSLGIVENYLDSIQRFRPQSDFLSRMTYLELKLRLPELLLMRVDKITMATSVEARVPFLDHHLVEYAMGLPSELKVKGSSGKHILKQALEGLLPHDLLYKKKRGFGAPIREWFRGASSQKLESMILSSSLRRRDYFDYTFIARLVDEHRSGKRDWSFHLWTLLNLALWYERWIDRS